MKIVKRAALATVAGLALAQADARAQSSSLHGAPGMRRPLTLNDNSWLYVKAEAPPEIQLNDIVTVIVDEKAQLIENSMLMRRQQTNFNADLQDWVKLKNFGIGKAPMTGGDPRIAAIYNLQNMAQAMLRSSDGLQYRIGATVVDVKPNGNLVLEAHRDVKQDNERWQYSLSGVVRRQDVLPNNTVLSEDVAELSVKNHKYGHIRDSWRRGWLWLFLDRTKPF